MNLKHLSSLVAFSVLGLNSAPALAESGLPSGLNFSCQIKNGVPVTVVEGEGSQQPIFHWDSGNLPESIDSQVVCSEVALKLEEHAATGSDMTSLRFISSQQGGLPAICATQDARECSLLLLTLAPTVEPQQTARLFLSSIIDKDLTVDKLEFNDRGFQSTSYHVSIWDLLGLSAKIKFLK